MSHVRRRPAASWLVLAAALVLVAALMLAPVVEPAEPAVSAAASKQPVTLRMTAYIGLGHPVTARLSCTGDAATASGYLRSRAARACRHARRIATFLASPPTSRERACTGAFYGPQTARVRGAIGSRTINRRFTRSNGCEAGDWSRAGVLLPPL